MIQTAWVHFPKALFEEFEQIPLGDLIVAIAK